MFLPLKDINPTVHFPIATILLIAINIIVFIYEMMLGPNLSQFIAAYGATPYELTRGIDLAGRTFGSPILHQDGPPVIFFTAFSSMFMHGGFFHILGNMLYLWIFGNNIEDIMGPIRFIIFYLLCGLIALGTHILLQPSSTIPTIGASGAVAGVLGAYLILFPRARVLTLIFIFIFIRLVEVPAAFLLIFWFVIQAFSGAASLASGLAGGIAWFAHIGGFVAGILLIRLMAGKKVTWIRSAFR